MKEKKFKPMLICNEEIELDQVNYPILASTKLDGIRCVFVDGEMLSRSFKPIQNKQLQERFAHLKMFSKEHDVILDGELYGVGLSFQEVTHFVMTQDLESEKNIKKNGHEEVPEALKFFCFDYIKNRQFDMPFSERLKLLNKDSLTNFVAVEQIFVNDAEEVLKYFDQVIKDGYEGLVLKNPELGYKCGRTTFNEQSSFKVKPYKTFDSKIVAVEERHENTNESFKNELGKSQKHKSKDAKRPTGIASTFVVDYNGNEQRVTITGTEAFRRGIWEARRHYINKWIEYKGMLLGSVDKIRHPTFLRFREDRE